MCVSVLPRHGCVAPVPTVVHVSALQGPEAPTANGSSAFSAVVQQRSTAELPQLSEPSGQEATALPIMSPAMRQQVGVWCVQQRRRQFESMFGTSSACQMSFWHLIS
jgi:hypothetical protein